MNKRKREREKTHFLSIEEYVCPQQNKEIFLFGTSKTCSSAACAASKCLVVSLSLLDGCLIVVICFSLFSYVVYPVSFGYDENMMRRYGT